MDLRKRQPDIQYKDFIIHNNTSNVELARNDITFNSPIIDDCSKYYLAINRFSVSHMAIPIMFWPYTDPLDTTNPYWVERADGLVRIPVVYDAANTSGNYSQFGYSNPIFYYEQICTMITTAIRDCLALPGDANAPFVQYAPNDEKFSIYFRASGGPLIGASIRLSSKLFQLFQFWRAIYVPAGIESYYSIDWDTNGINVYPANLNIYDDGTNLWYYIQQERSALYLLNRIQNIAFISNKIPTTKEYVPNLENRNLLNSRSILANFIPDLSQGRNLSEYQYYMQGQPLLINMESSNPLSTIDLQVYFVTKEGEFYPLYLEPGESIDIKLAFYKKSLYNAEYTSLTSDRLGTY